MPSYVRPKYVFKPGDKFTTEVILKPTGQNGRGESIDVYIPSYRLTNPSFVLVRDETMQFLNGDKQLRDYLQTFERPVRATMTLTIRANRKTKKTKVEPDVTETVTVDDPIVEDADVADILEDDDLDEDLED